MGQLTSETRTCTQLLPDASCKTNFNGNKTAIQLSTRIDLHSSTLSSQLTSETRTGTQLPVAMQLQNKLQWKHLSSMYLLALICIHPIYLSTDIWKSNVHTAASCSCKTNFNGKNCHPESRNPVIYSLICIHPLFLVNWHLKLQRAHSCQLQLQNKLQWKKTVIQFSTLICIHPWVNWHLKLERVRSCCQMPVAKQTSMETKLSSSYLLALICIHPIYLSTNIWLERAWGSAKKRSWHCTQLPVASCKAWGSLTSNICSNYLVEKRYLFRFMHDCRRKSDRSTMQNIERKKGLLIWFLLFICSFDFIKKWLIRVSDRCRLNKCISIN